MPRTCAGPRHAGTVRLGGSALTATTIALLNMKGGVGKTTLAVNLAWHLCREDHQRVLLVDLDPQFNASQYLMDYAVYGEHTKKNGTVADLLLDPRKERMPLRTKKGAKGSGDAAVKGHIYCVEKTQPGGRMDLLPSDLTLGRAVKNPHGLEFKLDKALEPITGAYDYIFIDCAPTDSVLTAIALTASNFVLTPVKPDRFSILGYQLMQRVMDDFRADYPDLKKVSDLGVVFTQVQGDQRIEEICIEEVTQTASYVFDTQIKASRAYLRSVQEQTPVFDTRYAPKITRASITDLVRELEDRIAALTGVPRP